MFPRVLGIVLVVLGALNALIEMNVGFGEIARLGLQGDSRFFQVIDEQAFLVRDSHIRHSGGLYGGIELFMILAVTNLKRYRPALNLVFALMFIGGLTRFTNCGPR
jgi:hypothetical protein